MINMSNNKPILERVNNLEKLLERYKVIVEKMEVNVFGELKDVSLIERIIKLEDHLKINGLNKPDIITRLETISNKIFCYSCRKRIYNCLSLLIISCPIISFISFTQHTTSHIKKFWSFHQ
jgi:hypothetical protein